MSSLTPVGFTAPRLAPPSPAQRQFPQGPDAPPDPGQPPVPAAVPPGSPLYDMLTRTGAELDSSLRALASVPPEAAGQPQFLSVRREAYDSNMRAQNYLATGFQDPSTPSVVAQTLHEADSKLEYANWKTVGKDFRTSQFIGFDIIGSMNDTMSAARMVQSLLGTGPVPPGPTPPGPVTPGPTPPGPTPPGPGNNLPEAVRRLLATADTEAGASMASLQQVPPRDGDNPKYLATRKDAYAHNMASQKSLEQMFNDTSIDQAIVTRAHQADAQLETANWSTVGKDPKTGGKVPVNIKASLTATNNARSIIEALLNGPQPQVEPPQSQNNGPQVEPPQSQNNGSGQSASNGDG